MGLQNDRKSIFKHLHREFSLKILLELNIQTIKGLPATKKNVCLEQVDHRLGDMGNPLSTAGTDHYFLWEVKLHFWLKSEHDPLSQRTEIKASLYFSVWRGHILPVVLLYPYSIVVPEVSIHRISNSAKICFEWWVAKLRPHMSHLGFSLSSSRDNNLNSNVLLHISFSCFVWNSDCSMGLENKHCILSEF